MEIFLIFLGIILVVGGIGFRYPNLTALFSATSTDGDIDWFTKVFGALFLPLILIGTVLIGAGIVLLLN